MQSEQYQEDRRQEGSPSIEDYRDLFKSRIPLLVITVLLFLLAGIYIVLISPEIYRATATVEIESEHKTVMAVQNIQSEDLKARETLGTIEHKIHRPTLIANVLNIPDVQNHPDLIPERFQWLPFVKKASGTDGEKRTFSEMDDQELIDMVSSWISVSLRRNTRLIDVSVEHPSRQVSRLIANSLVLEFNKDNAQEKTAGIKEAISFLTQETEAAAEKLQHAENAMQLYRNALRLKEDIDSQEEGLRLLEQRYRDKHPKLIHARRLYVGTGIEFLEEYQKARKQEAENPENTSLPDPVPIGSTETTAAGKLNKERLEIALNEFETRGSLLQRDLSANQDIYASLMKRLMEMDLTEELVSSEVTLIEAATLPSRPVKPKKKIIIIMSLILGSVVGLGLVMSLHLFDDTYGSVEAVERDTGARVLAAIFKCKELSSAKSILSKNKKRPYYVDHPLAYPSEEFRALRAGLTLMSRDEGQKTVMITSALAGAGKSTISANLAAAFAEQQERTILVDFDVRSPGIHPLFDVPDEQPGLVDHLVEGKSLQECICRDVIENLDILVTGSSEKTGPLQHMQESTIKNIVDELSLYYDRIIIDTAPILLVSEGLLIASHADLVCFVIKSTCSPKKAVRRAFQMLQSIGVTPSGVIVNYLTQFKHSSNYGGYGSAYGAGYGKK